MKVLIRSCSGPIQKNNPEDHASFNLHFNLNTRREDEERPPKEGLI